MRVTLRQLESDLGEHLARVQKGERVLVTLRGRVIAEIAPPSAPHDRMVEERLRRMAEAGDIQLPTRTRARMEDFEPIRMKKPRKARRGAKRALTASQMIIEDRG